MSVALVVLLAALTSVPLFKKLGLGSIFGYLIAGFVLGPALLGVFDQPERIMHFAELGVVMLLFLIGLELKPSRLWAMRRAVFGMGAAQVFLTTGVLFLILMFVPQFNVKSAFVVGLALSLSSTAFAIGLLTEKGYINTQFGRNSFAILLFQDIIAIPLLAFIPILAKDSVDFGWQQIGFIFQVILVIALMIFGGRYGLKYFFRVVARSRTREIFTAASLFIVLGAGFVMQRMELSMALGSFIAGLLLSDSEYRHQLESDLEPFKGLLLGLFFMSIGMSLNLQIIEQNFLYFLLAVFGLIAIKGLLLYGISKQTGVAESGARSTAIVLSQGGEFAFVVFAASQQFGLLDSNTVGFLIAVVTISMPVSAMLLYVNEKWLSVARPVVDQQYDDIHENNPVIIAGFGRFGQIPGRIMRVLGVGFTALEQDPDQVDIIRRFGGKIYYGDASRLDLLQAAGADKAKLFILAIDEIEASVKVAQIVRKHFPDLKILARARNRTHAFRLMDLGVHDVWRETLSSSLALSKHLLFDLGFSKDAAIKAVEIFRDNDQKLLYDQYVVKEDEKRMISASKEAGEQLTELLKLDLASKSSSLKSVNVAMTNSPQV
jgi:monovalent cation:proton antiporter-2 (CPA2) family protein